MSVVAAVVCVGEVEVEGVYDFLLRELEEHQPLPLLYLIPLPLLYLILLQLHP